MTSLIKKTLLGSAAVIGLLLATVFIFGSLDPISYTIRKETPIPRFEKIPLVSTLSASNITEAVAKEIAEDIVANNPEGPQAGEQGGLTTIDPETLTQDILARAFEEIRIEDLRPQITLSDLVIIKSTDKSFAEAYFKNINDNITRNFPEGISINWERPEETNFAALINAYALTMNDALSIAVPTQLAELHRKYISLLGAEKNTLTLIKNYASDPAQAAVAIEAGDAFTTELAQVLTEMNAYMSDHGITLATL